jgi:putative FmdB family regulatory protein
MRRMPMFDFECTKCKHTFEEIIPSDAAPPACTECGAPTEKVLSVGLGTVKKVSKKAEWYLNKDNQKKLREKAKRMRSQLK